MIYIISRGPSQHPTATGSLSCYFHFVVPAKLAQRAPIAAKCIVDSLYLLFDVIVGMVYIGEFLCHLKVPLSSIVDEAITKITMYFLDATDNHATIFV